jgi:hypothetical protein
MLLADTEKRVDGFEPSHFNQVLYSLGKFGIKSEKIKTAANEMANSKLKKGDKFYD